MYVYVTHARRPHDGPVYYFNDTILDDGNTETLKDHIVRVVNETMPSAVDVILTGAQATTEGGVAQLRRLRRDLRVVGCDLHLNGVAGPLRETLGAAGLPID
jgi:hypothetical protein